MTMVWLIAILMTLGVTVVVLRAFLSVPEGTKASELDVQVYKDQLQSLGTDVERGVLTQGEADAAKLEISRRILAADKRAQGEDVAGKSQVSKPVLALVALVLFGGSLGLYGIMGSPKMPDQPLVARLDAARIARANRPGQVEAEAQIEQDPIMADDAYLELVQKLRETMKLRADDVEGWKLLALHEARIGNVRAAWRAKDKVITLLGDKAVGEDYADLAEFMIYATKGYVSTDAEGALTRALKLDVKSPRARYYSGLALAQNGRPDVAYRMWVGLLEEGPEDAPWIGLIRDQIGNVARAAGIRMPAGLNAPGPSMGDVMAAQSMTEEERQAMVGGMVAQLSERLASEGGSVDEWARLIRAYGVLGETAKAADAWKDARAQYVDNPQALTTLREAARLAMVAN
jgi:cytochrome c-type biogenesis protein CcmH